jgi:hypothetical protein
MSECKTGPVSSQTPPMPIWSGIAVRRFLGRRGQGLLRRLITDKDVMCTPENSAYVDFRPMHDSGTFRRRPDPA